MALMEMAGLGANYAQPLFMQYLNQLLSGFGGGGYNPMNRQSYLRQQPATGQPAAIAQQPAATTPVAGPAFQDDKFVGMLGEPETMMSRDAIAALGAYVNPRASTVLQKSTSGL